jgi:hypothetical protein
MHSSRQSLCEPPQLQHLVSCLRDNMHTSLHESIKTRFFLRRLDERTVPLSLGDKKALRLLARQEECSQERLLRHLA